MNTLEKRLEYIFKNKELLRTALTHSSYANENRGAGCESNERLEFLGDSVLGMIVANHLYHNYSTMPEGNMTRLRAELVCEASLVRVAAELDLGAHIRLGKGEELSGGRQRPSILADCVEAVIAALYLDGGMKVAEAFIKKNVLSDLTVERARKSSSDYKTTLQELVQQKSGQALTYSLIDESGPDHMKSFTVQVCLNGRPIGRGTGRTKKEAEQAAACEAIGVLTK
ncbi:MAG TPA: ribonuclease III [Clostridiales bacterium]|nr:ribonuclease III [Clostridiales bacterium]